MFQDDDLEQYVNTSAVISSKARISAEWNMNDANNFRVMGNYRGNRGGSDPYAGKMNTWDRRDAGGWWKNATESDVEVFGPYDPGTDEPLVFLNRQETMKRLYSLDDCFKPHRPRSGINYLMFAGQGNKKYVGGVGKKTGDTKLNNSTVNRPRYYMSDMNASFKYWTSYRKERKQEYGISGRTPSTNGSYKIKDTMPFIVYKDSVPTNKLVFKMQTNVGTVDLGDITTPNGVIEDPLYGFENSTTPRRWDIEVLKGNTWTLAKRFGENEVRSDGSPIVGPDGYVELYYGVVIPDKYEGPHRFMGTVVNSSMLPHEAYPGDYYFVVPNEDDRGSVYLWDDGDWVIIVDPVFDWQFADTDDKETFVTDLVSPVKFVELEETFYKEFDQISGIRVVVYSMNTPDTPFELIEMSPRLNVDLTDKTVSVVVKKSTGSVDATALPVGGLQPGTGSIEVFDYDYAFLDTNTNSIISKYLENNITFSITDVIEDGDVNYYVPIKKLHTEGIAPSYSDVATVNFTLRDSFYLFEKETAPSILMKDISLSGALSILLDNIGFSNYVFLNEKGKPEPIIPYFFVAPDQTVAEVLQKLSIATQSAMYFDEYNNFVVAYKDYMFSTKRAVDVVLDGDSDPSTPGENLPNIINVASTEKKRYNGGKISYTERYIQRSIGSLAQANFVNADQSWIYLPALLWEVSGSEATRTVNDKVSTQSSYALAAMPLSSNLTADLPKVNNSRQIVNNVIDVGDNVYWLPRYNGYLYANGEIIKYDAVSYYVQGNSSPRVWISSNEEYQEYFSTLPFNGKMYPDGFIRIYSEPKYEKINGETFLQIGAVAKHGRGQFNTPITEHRAGLDPYWQSSDAIRQINMDSRYLFEVRDLPSTTSGLAGWTTDGNANAHAGTIRTGFIKNFMRAVTSSNSQPTSRTTAQAGVIQASALSMKGRKISESNKPLNYVTYVHKPLDDNFKHFGTRMRIIGKLEAEADVDQSPVGSSPYYTYTTNNGENMILNGGSGGLGIGVNPSTNMGYYLELIALTSTNLDTLSDDETGGHNIIFYKVARAAEGDTTRAIPIKLWGGLSDILCDEGNFVGEKMMPGDETTSVYDISVEWEQVASVLRFYIFINGIQVATVTDDAPITMYNSMALFVRGGSQLMFENIYALRQSLSQSVSGKVVDPSLVKKKVFGRSGDVSTFKKYGISGIVNETYLSGLGGPEKKYTMYYEEFGTIMRECSYFDIKYDKAYPALTSQLSPVLNDSPGYVTSGYTASSYGARFLVFNVMDKAISLDETSGNYLRIQGVTFTQNTTHELTMDDYFNESSNMSDPDITDNGLVLKPPRDEQNKFKTLKISRAKYGRQEWDFESEYIQTQAAARNLMEWLSEKTLRSRKLIGVEIFYNPLIQIGDIVTFSYTGNDFNKVAAPTQRFIIHTIEYTRDPMGPVMTIYVSEV